LFERLSSGGGQTWMTGTEPSLFDAVGQASWWAVSDGALLPA
jgi:hypothetical protein